MANDGMQPERSKPSKPSAKPAAKSVAKPMAKFVAKPAAKPVAKAAKKTAAKPAAKAVKKVAAKPLAKAVKKAASKPATMPAKKVAKQVAKKPAAKPAPTLAMQPAPKPGKRRGLDGDPASGTMTASFAWNGSGVTVTFPAGDLYGDNSSQAWTWNGTQVQESGATTSDSFNSSLATGNTLTVRQFRRSNAAGVSFSASGISRGDTSAVLR